MYRTFIFPLILISCTQLSQKVGSVQQESPLIEQIAEEEEPIAPKYQFVIPTSDKTYTDEDYVQEKEIDSNISGYAGVVTIISDVAYDSLERVIEIFNEDGSVWASFCMKEERDYTKSSFWQIMNSGAFKPRAFHPDYMTMVMNCVSQTDSTYIIETNKHTKETKILPKSKFFRFETWEEYVAGWLPGFDENHDTMYDMPHGLEVAYNKDEEYIEVLKVDGEWMKVTAGDTTGWMQWRDGDKLLLTIYYSM